MSLNFQKFERVGKTTLASISKSLGFLKSLLAAQYPIYSNYIANFWEILASRQNYLGLYLKV